MPTTCFLFVFFNDTATTEIYTLSLHDALPIWCRSASAHSRTAPTRSPAGSRGAGRGTAPRTRSRRPAARRSRSPAPADRKSTRLNSSHSQISYAVFCLKKKNKKKKDNEREIKN